ncbi:MAG: phosphoribosylamine--glycine ligase [Bacteroidales bacterium]|nr:phosphoribosylamine--glycine ligase [Bacteroidales bacterium]
MKALVLGSGGREHAILSKLQNELGQNNTFIMPGNGGTKPFSINGDLKNFEHIKKIVLDNKINLVICGPEQPLADGIADFFDSDIQLNKIFFVGPIQRAARLESCKSFAKQFMQKYHIPTANFASFNYNQYEDAIDFLSTISSPFVIKASGLAAGKGVIIENNINDAKQTIEKLFFKNYLGEAGKEIVIEEFINGIEMSVFIVKDGDNYILLPEAKDYKKIGEGDTGANTGGMGAASPTGFFNGNLKNKIINNIIEPTLIGLKDSNIDYKGFLFFGLMINADDPYLLEYNVRLGDPETQVVMPKIKSSFSDLCISINEKKLNNYKILTDDLHYCCITLAAKGYPFDYEKNKLIFLDKENINSIIFHGGTKINEQGQLVTSGGRVLYVVGYGDTIDSARDMAYKDIERIDFDGIYYRRDIGIDLLK